VPASTVLTIVSADAQGAHLTFDSTINQAYTIQFADNINEPAAWSNAIGFVDVPGTGSEETYIDAGAGTGRSPGRAYRLLVGLNSAGSYPCLLHSPVLLPSAAPFFLGKGGAYWVFIMIWARKNSRSDEDGGMANLYGALPSIMVVSTRLQVLKSLAGLTELVQ